MIQFAGDRQRAEFFDLSEGLRKKVKALEALVEILYGGSLLVTSIKRDRPITPKDTHFLQKAPWRFIDVVTQGVPFGEWESLRVPLNLLFPYGGKAGCESFTKFDHSGTGLHWHIQEKP